MSLEAAIIENTETMRRLIDALLAAAPQAPTVVVEEPKAKAEKPKAEKAEPKVEAQPEPAAAPVVEAEEAPAVSYDEVKNATLALSEKLGRDDVLKVLGEFGAQMAKPGNAGSLKPADYGKYVARVNELLGA